MEQVLSNTPYPGLPAFSRHQYDIFFGRDDHIDAIIEKLGASNFLCVTGSSGCGKSSLARTGLFNALEAGFLHGQGSDWVICDFSPGDAPIGRLVHGLAHGIVLYDELTQPTGEEHEKIEELEAFLRNHIDNVSSDLNPAADQITLLGDRPVIILVDQFEELFRFAQHDRHEAARFVDILLKTAQAKSRIFVVITVRTEELSKCGRYPGLTEAINSGQFLTPTLDRFQLQEAIEGPIRLFGGRIEPQLTMRILNDLEREMDKLPLMQHALKLLWQKKLDEDPDKAPVIGMSDFDELFHLVQDAHSRKGERRSALREVMSNRLDGIYNSLPQNLKQVAARAFCALTNVASQRRDIRNALYMRELAEIVNVDVEIAVALVRKFSEGDTGYLRCDGTLDAKTNPKIDVTHECVLRLWSRLQERWLPVEIKNGQILKEIARRAYRRKEAQQGRTGWLARLFDDRLLRDSELDGYENWWGEAKPNAAWAQRYLDDVNEEILRTRDEENDILRKVHFADVQKFMRESRTTARQRDLLKKVGVATAVVVVLLGGAYYLFDKARNEKLLAESETRAAATYAVAALDPSVLNPTPTETVAFGMNVVSAATRSKVSDETLVLARNKLWFANFHSYERRRLQHQSGKAGDVYAADFFDDGGRVVTLTRFPELRIWDLENPGRSERTINYLDALSVQDGGRQEGRSMRVAPDGKTAAIGTWHGAVAVIDLGTGEVRELHPGPNEDVAADVLDLSFSLDGTRLAASSFDGTVRTWIKSGSGGLDAWQSHRDFKYPYSVWSVGLNRDGRFLGAGLRNGMVCLTTMQGSNPEPVCDGSGHVQNQAVKALAFHPDDDYMVSAGNDDNAVMWSVSRVSDGSREFSILKAGPVIWHESDVWDITFDKSGNYIVTISWDGSIRVFDATTWKPLQNLRGHTAATRTVRFDPTSQYLISAAMDNTARVWSPFASLGANADFSHRFPRSQDDGAHRVVRSLAFGPNAEWVALTDGRDVFLKPAKGPIRSLVAQRNSQSPRPKYTQVDTGRQGTIAAADAAPEIKLWKPSNSGQGWDALTLVLEIDGLKGRMLGRPVAVGPNDDRVAVGLAFGPDHRARYAVAVCKIPPDARSRSCTGPFLEIPMVTDEIVSSDCRANRPRPNALAFSPDGSLLAIGAQDCTVRIYDVSGDTLAQKATLTGHVGAITALKVSDDGSKVISAAADHSARVMPMDGSPHMQLVGPHTSSLTGARLSPSGRHAITVSKDENLIVWDTASGNHVTILESHQSTILDLDLAEDADGNLLIATGSQNGELVVMPFFEGTQDLREFSRLNLIPVFGEAALDDLIEAPDKPTATSSGLTDD
ncbi:hypothetical protein K3722_04250 [Leisingera caerulea]|uniref:Novel STAND NTPase 1 domain-containing protein n=1 Tax=Leisingera caerulea TaxID=506591 RepID=A0ABY5WYE2_LEICA|nr:AAA family ATPase [Leisingera caerulea]UWQ59347.1 hypothetical protein K3722_04250 [Leisingera caerulea]